MNRVALAPALVLALAGAAPATAQDHGGGRPEREGTVGRGAPRGYANPSAVIAAELALDRDAQARGQHVALAASAAPAALVFAPRLVRAQAWLKTPAALPARRWRPEAVWSSCDGALVLSRGTWTGPGGPGWLVRVWQRQPDGGYKWLVGLSGPGGAGAAEPDMIAAQVADCPLPRAPRDDDDEPRGQRKAKPPRPAKALPPLDPLNQSGASPDRTVRWTARVDADGTQHLAVTWRKDGAERELLSESMTAN